MSVALCSPRTLEYLAEYHWQINLYEPNEINEDHVRRVGEALGAANLTKLEHEMLMLRYAEGLTAQACAELLGISLDAAEGRSRKALNKVRNPRPPKRRHNALCGTPSGADKHRRLRERICNPCKAAVSQYNAAYYRSRVVGQ